MIGYGPFMVRLLRYAAKEMIEKTAVLIEIPAILPGQLVERLLALSEIRDLLIGDRPDQRPDVGQRTFGKQHGRPSPQLFANRVPAHDSGKMVMEDEIRVHARRLRNERRGPPLGEFGITIQYATDALGATSGALAPSTAILPRVHPGLQLEIASPKKVPMLIVYARRQRITLHRRQEPVRDDLVTGLRAQRKNGWTPVSAQPGIGVEPVREKARSHIIGQPVVQRLATEARCVGPHAAMPADEINADQIRELLRRQTHAPQQSKLVRMNVVG